MSENTPYYVAVVPINLKGEVLIGLRQEDGIWTTPAGGADLNELPEDCAIRECWEEAQLKIERNALEPIGCVVAPNGKPVFTFLYRVIDEYTSVAADPDQEVFSWNWYDPDDLPEGLARDANKNRLDTINRGYLKYYNLAKSGARQTLLEKLQKSVVQTGYHNDGGDIETANFAIDNANADSELLSTLREAMLDFDYGDEPVEIEFEQGTLLLVKVDDNLYSGFLRGSVESESEDGSVDALVDNVKVRIEKQTLPTLTQTLTSRGWSLPKPIESNVVNSGIANEGSKYITREELLSYTTEAPIPTTNNANDSLTFKLATLSLLNKLITLG